MSRAQGIRGFSATRTCTPRITGKEMPDLGARVAWREGAPIWRNLPYRSDWDRTSAVKAS